MPNGTELHVGFFAPQSKHTWPWTLVVLPAHRPLLPLDVGSITHLVRSFYFQFCEDVPRLVLCGESHGGLSQEQQRRVKERVEWSRLVGTSGRTRSGRDATFHVRHVKVSAGTPAGGSASRPYSKNDCAFAGHIEHHSL